MVKNSVNNVKNQIVRAKRVWILLVIIKSKHIKNTTKFLKVVIFLFILSDLA